MEVKRSKSLSTFARREPAQLVPGAVSFVGIWPDSFLPAWLHDRARSGHRARWRFQPREWVVAQPAAPDAVTQACPKRGWMLQAQQSGSTTQDRRPSLPPPPQGRPTRPVGPTQELGLVSGIPCSFFDLDVGGHVPEVSS